MDTLVAISLTEEGKAAAGELLWDVWSWSRSEESDFIERALDSEAPECRLPQGFVVALRCEERQFTLKRPEVWQTFPQQFSLAGQVWRLYQFTDAQGVPLRRAEVRDAFIARSHRLCLPLLGPTAEIGICLIADTPGIDYEILERHFFARVSSATVEQLFAT